MSRRFTMGDKTTYKMNLRSLRLMDDTISAVRAVASRVSVYRYNEAKQPEPGWEAADCEGSLFVYERTSKPYWGFSVKNQQHFDNLNQLVVPSVNLHQESPEFMLCKDAEGPVIGLWFSDTDEATTVFEELQGLLEKTKKNEKPDKVVKGALAGQELLSLIQGGGASMNSIIQPGGHLEGFLKGDSDEEILNNEEPNRLAALLANAAKKPNSPKAMPQGKPQQSQSSGNKNGKKKGDDTKKGQREQRYAGASVNIQLVNNFGLAAIQQKEMSDKQKTAAAVVTSPEATALSNLLDNAFSALGGQQPKQVQQQQQQQQQQPSFNGATTSQADNEKQALFQKLQEQQRVLMQKQQQQLLKQQQEQQLLQQQQLQQQQQQQQQQLQQQQQQQQLQQQQQQQQEQEQQQQQQQQQRRPQQSRTLPLDPLHLPFLQLIKLQQQRHVSASPVQQAKPSGLMSPGDLLGTRSGPRPLTEDQLSKAVMHLLAQSDKTFAKSLHEYYMAMFIAETKEN